MRACTCGVSAIVLVAGLCSVASSQVFESGLAFPVPTVRTDKDALQLIGNRSIRTELGVSATQYRRFLQIQRATRDVLAGLKIERENATGGGDPESFRKIAMLSAKAHADQTIELRGVLTEAQFARLWQLVRYMEIGYLGFNGALADGTLGKEVGVHENQRHHLFQVGQRILNDADLEVEAVRKKAFESILGQLNEKGRSKARQLFGEYFSFVDPITQSISDQRATDIEQKAVSGEQPDRSRTLTFDKPSDAQFAALLSRYAVRRDLGLSDDSIDGLKAISEKAKLVRSGKSDELSAILDELLTPAQQIRLKQIMRFQLCYSSGFARAFTEGELAQELGVTEPNVLFERINNIESICAMEVRQIREKSHNLVLAELTPVQRESARRLLGPYFEYVDVFAAFRRDCDAGLRAASKQPSIAKPAD